MPTPSAPDDIVLTHAEGVASGREPLVVLEPLAEFLDAHGIAAGEGLPQLEPVGDGHSNITYRLTRGDRTAVLRRPPRGPLPPTAHDVLREARLLRALEATAARTPKVYATGDDDSIIGAPFYVMECVEGDVIVDSVPSVLNSPEEHRRIGEELVDALVEVHAVDWKIAGLPESGEATIVHGDYRLGNAMYASAAPAKLVAIFDWEMATIGDPLADVGYLCTLWSEADDPKGGLFELGAVTRQEGFPTRAELVARYEEGSGRSMQDVDWYTTLAIWKAVVFMEGNYKRAISGASDDEFLKGFGDGVAQLADRALAITRGEHG